LVPKAQWGRAVALNSSVFQLTTVVGPALGGRLQVAGIGVVYGRISVLAELAVLLMAGLRRGGRTPGRRRDTASLQALLSGLHFVRSKPLVLGAISLDLFAVLFGGATARLPVYAGDILAVGPEGLGLLRTAPAVGAAV